VPELHFGLEFTIELLIKKLTEKNYNDKSINLAPGKSQTIFKNLQKTSLPF
jgi:hypothetical protein